MLGAAGRLLILSYARNVELKVFRFLLLFRRLVLGEGAFQLDLLALAVGGSGLGTLL